MAKKKRKSGKPAARRVGAAKLNANNPIIKIGSIAAGFFFGDKINEQIDKVAGDKIDSKIIAAGQVGLGGLYLLKKGKKNVLLTAASGVMAGAGIKRAMNAFGIGSGAVSGYQGVNVVNGYQNVRAVGYKRMGAYLPGNGGMSMNGYSTAQGRNVKVGGTGLTNSGSGMMQ